MDNGQHFLVVDFVIPFYKGQGFTIERYGMLFPVLCQQLGQDCFCSKVRAVHFNLEEVQFLRRH